MQVAEVSRPLASVVVFDEDDSFIFNKMTGEINQLRQLHVLTFGFLLKVPRQVFTGSDDRAPQKSHKTHQHEHACGGSEVWGGMAQINDNDE